MEINSIGSAADNLAAVKKAETQASSILEAGNDLKKLNSATDEESAKKAVESVKDKAGSAEAAQGVTNAKTKEAGNTLDVMG